MTTQTRIVRFAPLAAVTLVVTGALLVAGPLNPPAGPVTSTFKTLTEVEPRTAINATNTPGAADSLFKITQPGSYYLTGNITGVVGKHGIEIVASGVTLDLNGFDLAGVAGTFDGVSVTVNSLTNIAVVNGSVRNWGDEGVDLGTLGASNCRVEGVLAKNNSGSGISTGTACTVSNCSGASNSGDGITVSNGCTVSNCSGSGNNANGINASSGTVSNCSAFQNTGSGIASGSTCTISNCTAIANGSGISTGIGCTVTNCTAASNVGNGITVSNGCTVSNCTAASNLGNGINAIVGSTVADCTTRFNTLDGILCSASCMIRGNTCSFNGNGGDGAGIHATGSDNRIEGNHCATADRGIDVAAAGNFIIKNTCAGNTTDWFFVSNNISGYISNQRGRITPAINGFGSFEGTVGTLEPHANFSY